MSVSILTFKVPHNRDLEKELKKALLIANWSVKHKGYKSSKDVKHFGLPSSISNQILRKYGNNKKARKVKSAKLIIPGQSISLEQGLIRIPCLKNLKIPFNKQVIKVNQIELGRDFAYISCSIHNKETFNPKTFLGIDLNTTGYSAVLADPGTGKVRKFNKAEQHYRRKYGSLAAKAQKQKKYKLARKHRNKEARKIKDINHKVSREIINLAEKENKGIRMEKLYGILKKVNKKSNKQTRKTVNSWSFYQLQTMIEYKAKLRGVPLEYINPEYTSQNCSRCGKIGTRKQKGFKCNENDCLHYDNADTNAAFNIANRSLDYQPKLSSPKLKSSIKKKHSNSTEQRTSVEGNTDLPRSKPDKPQDSESRKVLVANT